MQSLEELMQLLNSSNSNNFGISGGQISANAGSNANAMGSLGNGLMNSSAGGGSMLGTLQNGAAKAGNALSKAAPYANAAFGAMDVANSAKNGDYGRAGYDAVKTGASFIPVYGWAASAAMQAGEDIYDMFNAKKKQNQQKAMQMAQQSAENQQQQMKNQPQLVNDLSMQLGQQATQVEPLQGQVLLNNYQPLADVPNTSGTAIGNAVSDYMNGGGQQLQLPVMASAPQQAASQGGFFDKLANGLNDFSRGYKENYNNSFDPNNLTANQFVETKVTPGDAKMLEQFQNNLRKEGYNDDVITGVAEKRNSGYKPIADYINAHPEMYEQKTTNYYDKGKMARFGEAMGTLAKFAQQPAVQALIAGGLTGVLSRDPLKGLNAAYQFGNARAKSNIYEQALKQYGIDAPTGFFSNVGPQDLNAIGNLYYKDLMDAYRTKLLEEQANYHQGIIEQRARSNDIKAEKNEIDRKPPVKKTIIEHIGGGSNNKGDKPAPKPTKITEQNNNTTPEKKPIKLVFE